MRIVRGLHIAMTEETDLRPVAFTPVHLTVVVAVGAVLTLLGTAGCKKILGRAKTSEATQMLARIKGGEETYRAETLGYLDVSGGSLDHYFPSSPPVAGKASWDVSSCLFDPCRGFKTLRVKPDTNQVLYRYSVVAGPADGLKKSFDGRELGTATDPWYVAKARGDADQNGTDELFWTSSWNSCVWTDSPEE